MKKILKTIGRGISLLFKLGCLTVLMAILIPVAYFAWRINQPMDLPEFKGLTYVQMAEWRMMVRNEMSEAEQKKHPERAYDTENGCLKTDLAIDAVMLIPSAAYLRNLHDNPDLIQKASADERAIMPDGPVTFFNALPYLWAIHEVNMASYIAHDVSAPTGRGKYVMVNGEKVLVVCKAKLPSIPTPEEFEAMKREHDFAQSASVNP